MNRDVFRLVYAFAQGFVLTALIMLAMQVLVPVFGFHYAVGWRFGLELSGESSNVLYLSFLTPFIIGAVFVIAQAVEDYRSSAKKRYESLLKSEDTREFMTVMVRALLGMALGFVISMFLSTYLLRVEGISSLPFVFDVMRGGAVRVHSAIISLTTLLGLLYGLLSLTASRKRRKRMPGAVARLKGSGTLYKRLKK
ncbi:MAG: hypothetical protein JW834_01145 [Candidatus Diapherotrites archaeon]|nr:hypothetical protein [Candidatus Diapherotrites archaeon]